jgi:hypothetical protein
MILCRLRTGKALVRNHDFSRSFIHRDQLDRYQCVSRRPARRASLP